MLTRLLLRPWQTGGNAADLEGGRRSGSTVGLCLIESVPCHCAAAFCAVHGQAAGMGMILRAQFLTLYLQSHSFKQRDSHCHDLVSYYK